MMENKRQRKALFDLLFGSRPECVFYTYKEGKRRNRERNSKREREREQSEVEMKVNVSRMKLLHSCNIQTHHHTEKHQSMLLHFA